MIVRRQYRGGYQVTGLVELSRDRILNDTLNVLEEIAKCLRAPSERRTEKEESSRGIAT
jgi:hypothetical protein